MKRCFFIGHRDAPSSVFPQIKSAIEQCFTEQENVEFYVGKYGMFDQMVIQALLDIKNVYPQIKLYMVIPYHPSIRKVTVPDAFDGAYYPSNMELVPPRYAIVQANRRVIDQVDHVIAYCCSATGNTAAFVHYARCKKKEVTLLHRP